MNIFGTRTNLEVKDDPTSPLFDENAAPQQDKRRIFINTPPTARYLDARTKRPKTTYCPNKVRTSKYTPWTFLPKNIIEQFRGIANFYFLSLVILQAFDLFKTVDVSITAAPIVFIVGATACKDAVEDWKRHQDDSKVNQSLTYTLKPWVNTNFATHSNVSANFKKSISVIRKAVMGAFIRLLKFFVICFPKRQVRESSVNSPIYYPDHIDDKDYTEVKGTENQSITWGVTQWRDVRVGDFVFLRNKDRIPADIIIVSTSEPDSLCYVETKNLDGETNLKIKKGIAELNHIKTPADCQAIMAHIDSEPANNSLYTFNGSMSLLPPGLPDMKENRKIIPIGPTGILLRGCVLKNTKWVIGIVAFTGADTKLMLNSGDTPSKRSRVDKQINPHVLLNFCILGCMCLICGISSAFYNLSFQREQSVFMGIHPGMFQENFIAGVVTFFNCLIIFQNLIPIALYLSLEATKSVQVIYTHLVLFDS